MPGYSWPVLYIENIVFDIVLDANPWHFQFLIAFSPPISRIGYVSKTVEINAPY